MTADQAVAEVCRSWELLDPERLADLFANDGTYEDPLKDGILSGVEAIRSANARAMAMLADCEIVIARTVGSETVSMAEGVFRSALRAGGRLDFGFALVVEMEGGTIRRLAEYFDTRPLVP